MSIDGVALTQIEIKFNEMFEFWNLFLHLKCLRESGVKTERILHVCLRVWGSAEPSIGHICV